MEGHLKLQSSKKLLKQISNLAVGSEPLDRYGEVVGTRFGQRVGGDEFAEARS